VVSQPGQAGHNSQFLQKGRGAHLGGLAGWAHLGGGQDDPIMTPYGPLYGGPRWSGDGHHQPIPVMYPQPRRILMVVVMAWWW